MLAVLSAIFLVASAETSFANDVRLYPARRIDGNEQFFGHTMVVSRNPFYLGLEHGTMDHKVWITVYEVKPTGGVNRSRTWLVSVPRSNIYKDRHWFRIKGMTPGMGYAFSVRHNNAERRFSTTWWMCSGRWAPVTPTGAAKAIYVGNQPFKAYTPGIIGSQPSGGLQIEVLPGSVR